MPAFPSHYATACSKTLIRTTIFTRGAAVLLIALLGCAKQDKPQDSTSAPTAHGVAPADKPAANGDAPKSSRDLPEEKTPHDESDPVPGDKPDGPTKVAGDVGQGDDSELSVADREELIRWVREIGASIEQDEDGRLVSLVLGFTKIDDEGLAKLVPLKHLTFLGIDNTSITDMGLRHIAGMKKLKVLQLGGNEKVTKNGLRHLAPLAELEYLDLSDLNVDDASLSHLAKLSQLKQLNLGGTEVSLQGAFQLAKQLPQLEIAGPFGRLAGGRRLTLDPDVTDDVLAGLKNLGTLRELNLWECGQVTDAGMKHLQALDQLEVLELGYTQITDEGLKHLESMKSLKRLDLRETATSLRAALQLVVALPELHLLTNFGRFDGATDATFHPDVTDEQVQQLSSLPKLQRLSLWQCGQLTGEALQGIGKVSSLQQLNLGVTRIDDEGLKQLTELNQLRRLVLAGTEITDDGLAHLSNLRGLEELDLSNTSVSDKGLAHLASLTGLKSLNLGVTEVTDAGLQQLSGLKSLESLNLEQTRVHGEGLAKLQSLPQLATLQLSLSFVNDEGLKNLAELQGLKHLDMWGTVVTDAGIKSLHNMETLRHVGLFGTGVTEQGAGQLKQSLPDAEVILEFKDGAQ